MLRFFQPSSWFFIFMALALILFYATKRLPKKNYYAPMASPASLVSFGR